MGLGRSWRSSLIWVALAAVVGACDAGASSERAGDASGATARSEDAGVDGAGTETASATDEQVPRTSAPANDLASAATTVDGGIAGASPSPPATAATGASAGTSGDGFKSGPYVRFAATNELITERQALEWWPYGLMRPPADIGFDHVSLIAGSGGEKRGRENDPATDPCGIQLFYERGGSTASDAPYLELLRAGSFLVTVGWLPPDQSKQYLSYGTWSTSARNKPVTVRGQAGAMGQYKESNVRQVMWDKPHNGGWLLWTVQVSMERFTEEQTLDLANRLEEYGKRNNSK